MIIENSTNLFTALKKLLGLPDLRYTKIAVVVSVDSVPVVEATFLPPSPCTASEAVQIFEVIPLESKA